MDAQAWQQPRRLSPDSESDFGHPGGFWGNTGCRDCRRGHRRLSRAWPARAILWVAHSNRRHAAAVRGTHGARYYRLRRRCHGDCRHRRCDRGSCRVRSNERWRFLRRRIVGWYLRTGGGGHRLARRGSPSLWPCDGRRSCDWPVCLWTRYCARISRGKRQAKRKSLWMNRVSEEKSVRALLRSGIAELRDAHVPSYTLAAELLLLHVLGRDRTWMYSHPEEEISLVNAERYSALIGRRAAGEPTQHLTGKQEFWGLEFEVTPDVLIPRPETEHVIEVALDRLAAREIRAGRKQTLSGEGLRVADVGTGSGCIAIALAKDLPGAKFLATDISAEALKVAQRNAARLNVETRIHFVETNLMDGVLLGGAQHAAPLKLPATAPEDSSYPLR